MYHGSPSRNSGPSDIDCRKLSHNGDMKKGECDDGNMKKGEFDDGDTVRRAGCRTAACQPTLPSRFRQRELRSARIVSDGLPVGQGRI